VYRPGGMENLAVVSLLPLTPADVEPMWGLTAAPRGKV
jgi:hypothetical protein